MTIITLPNQQTYSQLRVQRERTLDFISNIADIALAWIKLAHQKALPSSANICRAIHDSAKSFMTRQFLPVSRFFHMCIDSENKPQALMITSEQDDYIHIEYLATCPHNISPKKDETQPSVKGAGSTLVLSVFQRALEQGKYVSVHPLSSAIGFYEKLGFTSTTWSEMTITADAISRLPQFSRVA